jgi:hypothetical protein
LWGLLFEKIIIPTSVLITAQIPTQTLIVFMLAPFVKYVLSWTDSFKCWRLDSTHLPGPAEDIWKTA